MAHKPLWRSNTYAVSKALGLVLAFLPLYSPLAAFGFCSDPTLPEVSDSLPALRVQGGDILALPEHLPPVPGTPTSEGPAGPSLRLPQASAGTRAPRQRRPPRGCLPSLCAPAPGLWKDRGPCLRLDGEAPLPSLRSPLVTCRSRNPVIQLFACQPAEASSQEQVKMHQSVCPEA